MPWTPLPTGEGPEPRRVGDSLDDMLASMGAPASDVVATVFARWEGLVGERVAAHATPVSLRGGRLVVAVDDPAWASQLTWMERDLLDRLGSELGPDTVKSLEVRVRP